MTTQLAFPSVVPSQTSITLNDLPISERPVHRIGEVGAHACNTAELLAVLIGGKDSLTTAHQLLAKCDSIIDIHKLADTDLAAISGIGPTTVARLKAAIELGQRLACTMPNERPTISSPADAAHLLMPEMSTFDQEHLRVILLDTRNRVLAIVELYKGSLNSATIRVGEVFKDAVRRNAAGIIVVHNHPSGDPAPSPDDVAVTRMLVEAGKLLDVQVCDHLVIGAGRFVSLKERGLGFS